MYIILRNCDKQGSFYVKIHNTVKSAEIAFCIIIHPAILQHLVCCKTKRLESGRGCVPSHR